MSWIRRMLQGLRVAPSDEELGRKSSVYPDEPRKLQQNGEEAPSTVLETSEKLKEFRMLVGITTHHSFRAPRGFNPNHRPVVTVTGRPAPNPGLYMTVCDQYIKSKRNYKWFAILINSCLGLQIVVAAALTALGAANGSRGAVTVFGAINTVIAGFLTYLKGSGLPNRLKYFHHEWAKVKEYVEERERDLSSPHNNIDIHAEIAIIRTMYEQIKADIEANTPDRFVGSGGYGGRSGVVAPGPPLAGPRSGDSQGYRSPKRRLSGIMDGFNDAKHRLSTTYDDVADIEKQAGAYEKKAKEELEHSRARVIGDVAALKMRLQEKIRTAAHLQKRIESEAERELAEKHHEIEEIVEDKGRDVSEFQRSASSAIEDGVNIRQADVLKGAEEVLDTATSYVKPASVPHKQSS